MDAKPFEIVVAARTHVGQVRSHNEDNFLVGADLSLKNWNRFDPGRIRPGALGTVLMVADGMGGTNAGEVAADIAVSHVQQLFSELANLPDGISSFMAQSLLQSHAAIGANAQEEKSRQGMGTTAVLAWIIGNHLHLVWSGDSRAYVLDSEKELHLLSQDHSLVWDMVKKGEINAEEARVHPQSNIITQSLGDPNFPPEPEDLTYPLLSGSRILLCSDGLNGMLPDSQIRAILASPSAPSQVAADLIQAANDAGGEDNITVVVADYFHVEDDLAQNDSINQQETVEDAAEAEEDLVEPESPESEPPDSELLETAPQRVPAPERPFPGGWSRILMFLGGAVVVILLLIWALSS